MKPYNDLYTIEDWLQYFNDASHAELKAILKSLPDYGLTKAKQNKRKAIIALLA